MFGNEGWEEDKTRELLDRVVADMRNPLLRSCVKV